MSDYFDTLCNIVGENRVLKNEPMKHHTTFKIGGKADYFVKPVNELMIRELLDLSIKENLPLFIMGNGSNLLVTDKGIRGIVVSIGEEFSNFSVHEDKVTAQAGILLSTLSKKILSASLEGFEFASGIPGTLGGGIFMNAGAYGGEMKDVIETVTVMDKQGNIFNLSKDEMKFGYRKSVASEQSLIILSAVLQVRHGNFEEIKQRIDDFTLRRTTKQPLWACSAGSTFKRPEGHFAGKLIEDSGLKGVQMGAAAVSDLHSGFVINTGDASCQNVIDLICFIKARVYTKFGIRLEEEVKIVGEK